MTKSFLNRISHLTKKKYIGNEHLFESMNIFDSNDLFQDCCEYLLSLSPKDETLMLYDICNYIKYLVRRAKQRHAAASQDTFTGYNMITQGEVDNFIEWHGQ